MLRRFKKTLLICSDVILIGFAFALAHFYLIDVVRATIELFYFYFIVVSFFYLILGYQFKIFSQLNRYTGMKEILRIFMTMSLASIMAMLITNLMMGMPAVLSLPFPIEFSIRVFFLGYLFASLFIVSSRVGWRIFVERKSKYVLDESKKKRTLVLGAGSGADVLFNSLKLEDEIYKIIGVLDDDKNKKSTYIHGHPVIGKLTDLRKTLESGNVDHVILAIPSLNPESVRTVLDECNRVNVSFNTLPPISKLLESDAPIDKLRDIDITDLLGRDEVELDMKKLSTALHNNTILVTGAGGSIGSEICRQIAKFKPHRLILLGHGENSIYLINKELLDKYGYSFEIAPVIADIQDRDKMFEVMEFYRPNVVYHTAGHKHVPLMEANPFEAVKNNVFGTRITAEAAKAAKVENFVMISTDKAVKPPNVMGATKRIAEMIVTGLNKDGDTKFSAVRFGNVLGSRGSVVPLFKEQIAKGGPLTITDLRMTRYFMTIPEASKLVIQAGTLARGGEIFILDMGNPVRIYDLARNMIMLSGYTESEIQIIETGVRPGEKLFEELLLPSEETDKKVFEKIFIGNGPRLPIEDLYKFIDSLENSEDLRDRLIGFANCLEDKSKRSKVESLRVVDVKKKGQC